MSKILFLTARTINPVIDGRRTTLKQMIRQVYDSGSSVYLCCMASDEEIRIPQPVEISEMARLRPTRSITKAWNILTKTLFKKWMIQNSAYYSRRNQILFDNFVKKIKPDVIVCDADRMSPYLLKSKANYGHKYLDMDDRVSVTLAEQLNHMDNNANIYGNFSKQMPPFLLKFFNILHLGKIIVKIELKLALKFEKKAPFQFEKIFLVSPVEVQKYVDECGQQNIFCLPVAVNDEYFSEKIPHSNLPDTLCFLGNMKIAHNEITLDYLIKNVLLPLRRKFPLRLLVVGQVDERVISLFSVYSDFVSFSGAVEDIRPICEQCFCMAAPIVYGSGIKIKILEAMAMGIPVITNDVGLSGIEALPNSEIIVSNSPAEMINNISRLYQDPSYRRAISSGALAFIKMCHSYKATAPIIVKNIVN
jgi:glycosyltransferase involved in cell wall biosynthesis